MNDSPMLVIMGPTASGKTSLAVELAKALNGEIVTADSMQLYRGLDIGTAKPTEAEKQGIPHHLIDVLGIEDRVDVFTYVELAEAAISNIRSQGKLPILAGGSGMYIRGLLYGLDPLPADPALRAELDTKYDHDEGFEALKSLMAEKDPEDFQRWQQHRRKLIRALEVFELTGKSITELQTTWNVELRYPVIARNLTWDNAILRDRINQRTHDMLKAGWIEEAKDALERGILSTPTAHQVLGYRIINEYLQGNLSYDEMEAQIATKTWHLARRQMTWFRRKHPEAQPLAMPQTATAVIEDIRALL